MYRCEKCNTIVPPGRKVNRVVVETREKSYPIFKKSKGKRGRKRFASPEPVANAQGWEIAKELEVCASCAAELNAAKAEAEAEAQAQAAVESVQVA